VTGEPFDPRVERLLGRATYGPRPGDRTRLLDLGADSFLDEQLAPDTVDDREATLLVRHLESLALRGGDLFEVGKDEILADLRRATLLRALYSRRQLQEVTVELLSDHFNVYAGKGDGAWLKVIDDRETIRPHVFGPFRDLLRATVTSPAMLVYLDGASNRRGKPNENHARELLELHTLGVDGGYGQRDVMELARALTGWRLRDHLRKGRAVFDPSRHDPGAKRVLDEVADGAPGVDLDELVDRLASHPATATLLATKLCRRFVADEPGAPLVARTADVFRKTGGHLGQTLSSLLRSEELQTAPPKLKRPYAFALSALRACGAASDGGRGLQDQLRALGQLPFDWPTPDGYPDGASHWSGPLLSRWNFALRLTTGGIRGTSVPDSEPTVLAESALGRRLTRQERATFGTLREDREAFALALCHPGFQYG